MSIKTNTPKERKGCTSIHAIPVRMPTSQLDYTGGNLTSKALIRATPFEGDRGGISPTPLKIFYFGGSLRLSPRFIFAADPWASLHIFIVGFPPKDMKRFHFLTVG